MSTQSSFDLKQLAGGAVVEKLTSAYQEVLQNLQDPNVPYKPAREIKLSIKFTQNENRNDAIVVIAVTTKLAPVSEISTQIAMGIDSDGKAIAQEYTRGVYPNQTSIEDLQEVADPETGELPEFIDLRAYKKG